MAATVNRPPQDITPQRFFEEWLPAEFARVFGGSGVGTGGDLRVRVDLHGDGGGAWDLQLGGGTLRVGPAGSDEAAVTIRQTVADWKAVAVGEPGAIDLAPAQASPLDILFVDPASRQVVAQVRGAIRFEVTGFNGRTWMLSVQFGGGPAKAAPDATISVDAETYSAMLARKIAPPEAFFGGKIKLSGDTGLAMQLGMAMLPRFSR